MKRLRYSMTLAAAALTSFTTMAHAIQLPPPYWLGLPSVGRVSQTAQGPDGRVFAPSMDDNLVRVYDENAVLLTTFGTPGQGPGQFQQPSGVALDLEGNLYVCDQNNHRVQKF